MLLNAVLPAGFRSYECSMLNRTNALAWLIGQGINFDYFFFNKCLNLLNVSG